MRYEPEHKERTRRRIVKSASRQFRAEGINGTGVARLMKSSGLTQGGFYKHFTSKDQLFAEAIDESVREIGVMLAGWARGVPRNQVWKEIVKNYLSLQHCEHPGIGCPIAALAADIARTRPALKKRIRGSMDAYREQFLPFMPGDNLGQKQKNFALIFTAMIGAMAVARTMPDREEQERLLALTRNHLLSSF